MTHPLVSKLAPLMESDISELQEIVAQWILGARTETERAVLRYFGGELGAVQRRIQRRQQPPSEEEIEIALTAVLALMHRRVAPASRGQDPALLHLGVKVGSC